MTKLTTNKIMNKKKRIFAMPANATAIPPNPKKAAISAITKNTSASKACYLLAFSTCRQGAIVEMPFTETEMPRAVSIRYGLGGSSCDIIRRKKGLGRVFLLGYISSLPEGGPLGHRTIVIPIGICNVVSPSWHLNRPTVRFSLAQVQ